MSTNNDSSSTVLPNYDNSILFDVYRKSDNKEIAGLVQLVQDEVVKNDLFVPRKDVNYFLDHIKAVIFNCCLAYRKDREMFVAVARNADAYLKGKRMHKLRFSERYMIGALDLLIETGFIEQKLGFHDRERLFGMCTRIKASEKLASMIEGLDVDMLMFMLPDDSDPLVFRDEGDKVMLLPDSPETKSMCENVLLLNSFTKKHCINLHLSDAGYTEMAEDVKRKAKKDRKVNVLFPDLWRVSLRRVFCHGSMVNGGRYYGTWYQSVPRKYRQLIQIDGQPTVELDYSWLHPMLLYRKEGLTLDADPYMLAGFTREQRKKAKPALNIMINAESEKEALKAINSEVYCRALPEPFNTAPKLMAAYKERHKPIKGYFSSGAGVTLQYLDSRVAEHVMLSLMEKGIVCLPVHDSFIVQRDKQEELSLAMTEAFRAIVGIEPIIEPAGQEFYEQELSKTGAVYGRYQHHEAEFKRYYALGYDKRNTLLPELPKVKDSMKTKAKRIAVSKKKVQEKYGAIYPKEALDIIEKFGIRKFKSGIADNIKKQV